MYEFETVAHTHTHYTHVLATTIYVMNLTFICFQYWVKCVLFQKFAVAFLFYFFFLCLHLDCELLFILIAEVYDNNKLFNNISKFRPMNLKCLFVYNFISVESAKKTQKQQSMNRTTFNQIYLHIFTK